MRERTWTTAADAPAFPPERALLDALEKISETVRGIGGVGVVVVAVMVDVVEDAMEDVVDVVEDVEDAVDAVEVMAGEADSEESKVVDAYASYGVMAAMVRSAAIPLCKNNRLDVSSGIVLIVSPSSPTQVPSDNQEQGDLTWFLSIGSFPITFPTVELPTVAASAHSSSSRTRDADLTR